MEEGFTPADLDHGFFQMSRPSLKHGVAYAFASLFFLVSLGLFATSLSIPDAPNRRSRPCFGPPPRRFGLRGGSCPSRL